MLLSLDPIQKLIALRDITISEEEFDEDFNAITSFVERGEYEEARPLIESNFKKKICDIRLILYWTYISIHSEGIKSLCTAIPLLNQLLTSDWEKLSPQARRDQHAQKSVRWFFSRLIKMFEKVNLSYKNKDYNAVKLVTNGVNHEMINKLKEDVSNLNKTLSDRWDNSTLNNHLLNVQKCVTDLFLGSLQLHPKKEEALVQGNQEKEIEKPEESVDQEPPHAIPLHLLEPSEEMKLFYQKLEAFQLCVEKGDYKKSAIIADDIDKKVASFDPSHYFPKIFLNYYSLYAKNAAKLEEGLTSVHPSLIKLYEADLQEFIKW